MSSKADLKKWKARRVKIVKLRNEGMSFADIGRRFLISRERARQIYNLEKASENVD